MSCSLAGVSRHSRGLVAVAPAVLLRLPQEAAPLKSPQEPYDPWTVLLYLRDNPAVHAQLSSRDIEGQLAEIAGVLSLPRHEIVHTYRANVALPDLSAPYAADYPSHR